MMRVDVFFLIEAPHMTNFPRVGSWPSSSTATLSDQLSNVMISFGGVNTLPPAQYGSLKSVMVVQCGSWGLRHGGVNNLPISCSILWLRLAGSIPYRQPSMGVGKV